MKYDSIIDLFDEFGIEYYTTGKNIASGWIGIQCCFCEDDSNHLGIRLKDHKVTCWKCGGHSLYDLIKTLTDIPRSDIFNIAKQLSKSPIILEKETSVGNIKDKKLILPAEATVRFPKIHLNYLKERGFPPQKTIDKYKLLAVHNTGKYRFRIIIPVFMNKKLVNFTARGITENQIPKYLMASDKECLIDRSECVFNIDTLETGGNCILVEGPLDVMKLGDGAVCFFGVQETEKQIKLLKQKQIRNLYVLYDNDSVGVRSAERISRIFAPLVKKCEIVNLQEFKDPGEMSVAQAQELRRELGFTI